MEEEGDVAADFLEELLDIADLDGDLDIDVEDGRASVSVVADDAAPASLSRLVGRDGEVLEALQELTRLAVQARTGERSRLVLDVGGYRQERRGVLERLAREAVEEVRSGAQSVHLEAMNPYERKIVHDVVAGTGLTSESEGAAGDRHVVVTAAP
ncbi:Jag family protein [Pseudokineococcus sp. 1T1Z-3]|uniref:Jag family protein n=1 Tax=Pseudokineococcus sp. 1T1Z-3 TaxID=3132745 RepID=UPI00403F1AF1